jgi:hypothetical protein
MEVCRLSVYLRTNKRKLSDCKRTERTCPSLRIIDVNVEKILKISNLFNYLPKTKGHLAHTVYICIFTYTYIHINIYETLGTSSPQSPDENWARYGVIFTLSIV